MIKLWLVDFETPHEYESFVIQAHKEPTEDQATNFAYLYATANVQGINVKQTSEKEIRFTEFRGIVNIGDLK
jgi:hypothetical protein